MKTSYKHNRKTNKKRIKGGKTIKKMNCSPIVENNTPVKGSCFTSDALQLLKDSYNKYHEKDPIKSEDSVNIWKDLKERLKTCDKEDCWLGEIKDKNLRKKLDEFIFAPDHPEEWKKKPNEWLSNFDIMDVLKQYMVKYPNFYATPPSPIDFDSKPNDMFGQCVSNELCTFNLEKHIKNGKTKFGLVFNLSPHTSSGSHWVSLFIDVTDKIIFYMDSAGNKIPRQINTLVSRIIDEGKKLSSPIEFIYYENYPMEHQMGNSECGMFSLFFIITMITDKANGKIFKNMNEKIKFFKEKRIPDKYVFQFRKIYFNEK
jgi:hypothetical protein